MKKNTFFAVIGILFCVLTVSQAYAGYKIFWWGNYAGSIPTTETARTEQASIELFNQLFPDRTPYPAGTSWYWFCNQQCMYWVPNNCVGDLIYDEEYGYIYEATRVYESGIWDVEGGINYEGSGYWDVFLDDAPDSDGDFVPDEIDNCPNVSNSGQEDSDNDGKGDVCDTMPDDFDNDGTNDIADNCPMVANSWQVDEDNDSIGDVCDSCPNDENNDADSDGLCGDIDNCPNNFNQGQEDVDNDTLGDVCDTNTIYGNILGEVQEDITVNIYILSCGLPQPHATVTTNAQGYYSVGNLANGSYLVQGGAGYSFIPGGRWVNIPWSESQSYNFTTFTCATVDRFLDNADGTVTDCRTGLIWLQNINCYYNYPYWDTAMSVAAGLNTAECGLTDGSLEGDWRLPTKDELQGIGTDPPTTWESGTPTVTWTTPDIPFVGITSYAYWSSTTDDSRSEYAWRMYISNGSTASYPKMTISPIWPVRLAD
jgi:hypothetical protein